MIAKLRGIIDSVGEDYCVIDVNGVGYLVAASVKTLSKLSRGAEVSPPSRHEDTSNTISSGFSFSTV